MKKIINHKALILFSYFLFLFVTTKATIAHGSYSGDFGLGIILVILGLLLYFVSPLICIALVIRQNLISLIFCGLIALVHIIAAVLLSSFGQELNVLGVWVILLALFCTIITVYGIKKHYNKLSKEYKKYA